MKTQLYLWCAYAALAFGTMVVLYVLAATPPVVASVLGERGSRRRRAIAQGGLFASAEPAIRKVAGWLGRFELTAARVQLEKLLRSSGYVLGLMPDELIALMIVTCVAATSLAALFSSINRAESPMWTVGACVLGFCMPYLRIQDGIKKRHKSIDRGLPIAIDLVSLCVGAGTDFPSALKFVVNEMNDETDPTREEFVLIVQQLEVGHTRGNALATFAERVPTDSVRDFVNAVTQAEEKGTPLAEVLAIQARMLRMRRSVAAEEAAARAGVMLIGPLMLQLCAIMLILFSPFLINGLGF